MPLSENINNILELDTIISKLKECDKSYQESLELTKEIEVYKKYKELEIKKVEYNSSSASEKSVVFIPKSLRDVSSYFKMTLEAKTVDDLANLYNNNVNGDQIIDLVLLNFIQELNQIQLFYYSITDDDSLKSETYEYLCQVKKSRDMLIEFKQNKRGNRYVRTAN